jgi:hypothetical protein
MNTTTTTDTRTIARRVADAFPFHVGKLPLSGPDRLATPWYGLFRDDTGAAVGTGSVSARYQPHQTDDVVALVEAAEQAFGPAADVRATFRNGHVVTVQPSRDYRVAVYGTADAVFPRIIIDAGYGRPFSASVGYYRDLCRNMGIIRSVESSTTRLRHTHQLRQRMPDLIDQFSQLTHGWGALTARVHRMEAARVSLADFLNYVYPAPAPGDGARATSIHRARTEAIFRRVLAERDRSGRGRIGSTWEVSVWEAWNGVQGYVQHDAARRGLTRADLYGRAIAALDDAAVVRAESHAVALSA